jgi:hypothetical protein
MDISLLLLGAIGALVTVYVAKDQVIPEFRPLFDIAEHVAEAAVLRAHIDQTRKEINETQGKLKEDARLPDAHAARLQKFVNTSHDEIKVAAARLAFLEKRIVRGQTLSRGLGFFFYIVLGGIFGSLLAGRVQVLGANEELPDIFEAMLIGATWTTYLAAVGYRTGQKLVEETLTGVRKESIDAVEHLKKELTEMVGNEMAKIGSGSPASTPSQVDGVAKIIAASLDQAGVRIQTRLDVASHLVRRDMKGML